MRRKKGQNLLTPGGKLAIAGVGVVVVLFLGWQFVLSPLLSTRSQVPGTQPETNANTNSAVTTTSGDGKVTTSANSASSAKPELTGQIVDGTNGQPIATASIKKSDGSELVKSDNEGKFVIAKLPADKNKLMIFAPGYNSTPLPLTPETTKAIAMQPVVLNGQLLDADTQKPIANRMVFSTNGAVLTDENGKFSINKVTEQSKISVDLVGYEKIEQAVNLNNLNNTTVTLRSTSFDGSLTDASTGKPIFSALVKVGEVNGLTNNDGKFHISDAPHTPDTEVTVRAAGYKIQNFKASELAAGVKIQPFHVRSVYAPGILAINANWDDLYTPYLKMADQGLINSIVVAVKDDDTGLLWYDSQVPIAQQLGLVYAKNGIKKSQLMDPKRVVEESHKHGLYVIARFVVYRDPALASKKPEWAVKSKKTGKNWLDQNGLAWPNQFVPEVGDYEAALAKELAGFGFDEVQYDYIRFPTDGELADIQYKPDLDWKTLSKNEKLRTDTIESTVRKGWENLRYTNTFFSLDVFGYSLWREDDADGIGQQYNNLIYMSDYICPMIYPTHFTPGEFNYPNPGAHPKEIYDMSGKLAAKLEDKYKPFAKYRPWVEDFDKTWGPAALQIKNTPERVRTEIEAADNSGATGWMLWNANGKFSTQALQQTAPARR